MKLWAQGLAVDGQEGRGGEGKDLVIDFYEEFAMVADAGGGAGEGAVVELEFDLFVEEVVEFSDLSEDFGDAATSAPHQTAIERPQNAFLNSFRNFRLGVELVGLGVEVQGGCCALELGGQRVERDVVVYSDADDGGPLRS